MQQDESKWQDFFTVGEYKSSPTTERERIGLSMGEALGALNPPITNPKQIEAIEKIAAANIVRPFKPQAVCYDVRQETLTFQDVVLSFNIGVSLLAKALVKLGATKIQIAPRNEENMTYDVRVTEGAREVAHNLRAAKIGFIGDKDIHTER